MPNQVDGAFVRCAMSGTELSRVRTEFRLRPPERINQSLLESRGRHCYAIKCFWADFTCPVCSFYRELAVGTP